MLPKSIKAKIRLTTLFIVALAMLLGVNAYLGRIADRADTRYHSILMLQNFLSELVHLEDTTVADPSQYPRLQKKYDQLAQLSTTLNSVIDEDLQMERRRIFEQLLAAENECLMLHRNAYKVLPQLAASVRYIHEHHIAYLKNLMARSAAIQDYDTGKNFQRSPVKSASELDIVSAATAIQTSLLDLLTHFYVLQQNREGKAQKAAFMRNVKKFYDSVNNFEDYSLDAQDGLLVEELLMTGRTLEESFARLLEFQDRKRQSMNRLTDNRSRMAQAFRKASETIVASNREIITDSERLQLLIFLASLLLAGFVLYCGRSIIRQILETVEETKRIQEDLSYRIDVRPDVSSEFQIVQNALNTMATTIDNQFRELDEAREYLEIKVREKTSELIEINRQLRKEIEDHTESERARGDLEAKLNRAEKMEAIGTLAGGVAHDLNNILSGIVTYPDLILMDLAQDDPLRKAITTIKTSGEKAAAIVQDLLTLARRNVMDFQIVRLNDVVTEFLDSPEFARISEDHAGLEVDAQLNSRFGVIKGSSVHLSKTFMNLIINAAEAISGNGKIIVTSEDIYIDTPLRGYDDVNEGEYARLTVSDNGVGMSPEVLERIFEPFFTRKQMGRSGTGLGMAVVWGTVKDHHGYIDVESSEGKGTTFQLYFPLCRDSAAMVSPRVDIESIGGRGESVLVVDDILEQREIATDMLKRLGYLVESAASGEQALAVLRERKVDVLLLDMVMPAGMDGLETYQKALEIRPGQKTTIASGFSETSRVKAALDLGAGVYLRKPYSLEAIAQAVRSTIDGISKNSTTSREDMGTSLNNQISTN